MSPVIMSIGGLVVLVTGFATWKAPRLTSVILWALLATVFFSSFLLIKLPGKFSENALWLTLAVPVIWTVFQFWTYWDRKAWRVTGGLMALTVICAAIVLTSEPPI